MTKMTKESDAEYKKLLGIKQKLKPLHDKIRRSLVFLQITTTNNT